MIKTVVTGACGKMGRAVLKLALEDEDLEIAGIVETKGHQMAGKRHDLMTGEAAPFIADNIAAVITGADVVIDFTEAGASLEHLKASTENNVAHVIGTTGFSEQQIVQIKETKGARVVLSPNMSVGMNVLFDLAEKASSALSDGYDVEMVEMHHRWKKDAPSGSALSLVDAVKASHSDRKWVETFGRRGITGERMADEIGVMSVRAGDIVGEHTLFFAGLGERIELTHRAYSRDIFARGSIIAAKWLVKQPAGIYSMKDVLFS